MCLVGEGTKRDYVMSLKYYLAAAQEGNLIGIFQVATMHQLGLGTSASCLTAASLFKKIAERGKWTSSLHQAYDKYQKGDYATALLIYEKAAEQGKTRPPLLLSHDNITPLLSHVNVTP